MPVWEADGEVEEEEEKNYRGKLTKEEGKSDFIFIKTTHVHDIGFFFRANLISRLID